MPLGATSRQRLTTCHPDLQVLVEDLADAVDAGALAGAGITDVTVLCGYRGQAEQDDAYARGTSKVKWPNGKHNRLPAMAVDVAPYPVPKDGDDRWAVLRGFILALAAARGIKLRTISWDYPHQELA